MATLDLDSSKLDDERKVSLSSDFTVTTEPTKTVTGITKDDCSDKANSVDESTTKGKIIIIRFMVSCVFDFYIYSESPKTESGLANRTKMCLAFACPDFR